MNRNLSRIFILLLTAATFAFSQVTYDLRFVEVTNDQTNGGNFDVKVQIKSNNGEFGLGTSNLVFTYNTAGLKFDSTYTVHNFQGFIPPSTFYNPLTVTEPALGRVSVNIDLSTQYNGDSVRTTYKDVATINFTIKSVSQTTNLKWRTASPNETQVFDEDQSTLIPYNSLNNSDTPLPISLSSFTATAGADAIELQWVTESEISNAGFEIWRSTDETGTYTLLSSYQNNPALVGHGTTTTRNEYQFTDTRAVMGQTYWYKLADVDYNGVRQLHFPVSATISLNDKTISSISGNLPDQFKLYRNYPNPFNPSTTLRFDIPPLEKGAVKSRLEIYNSRGQRVKTLFDGRLTAGSYQVEWNGTDRNSQRVASGIYIAFFRADYYAASAKLILVK